MMEFLLVCVFVSLIISKVEGSHGSPTPPIQNGWERLEKNIGLPEIWGRLVSEGLTHDDTHWYVNSKTTIFKAEKDMKKVMENKNAIPKELKDQGFKHIGDIDLNIADGLIFGGIEQGAHTPGIIASWNATDLSLIKYKLTEQDGMPWVAADSNKRLLYSTAWSDVTRINVFDMDTFEQRNDLTIYPTKTTNSDGTIDNNKFPSEIQGAAFYNKDPNQLYISINGKESIYKINIMTGECQFILSDEQYKHHEAEMEGLTFWDLDDGKHGQMHMFGNFELLRQKGLHSYKDHNYDN